MKKRIVTFCVFVFSMCITSLQAQSVRSFDLDLWENGLPNTNGVDHLPADEQQQNYIPSIRVFLPAEKVATGRAVIACPGGAYYGLAYHHEGYDWAPFFNKQGIALIVLKYRMPKGVNKDVPFSDVEEAMRQVKAHAGEWNINPDDIGIMGSSAGGHLASTFATKAADHLRPAFQILFYPVITMDKSFTHMGSHDNLLGSNATPELEVLYSGEKQVDNLTPRALILFSDDDDAVPSQNGTRYYEALKAKGIPASMYIWPSGGHGWGNSETFLYKNEMQRELTSWLNSF